MHNIQIDLKKEIEKKSPVLTKIPFLIPWLRRIIHEDGINECLRCGGESSGVAFASPVLDFFGIRIEKKIIAPLDQKGRYIFVANHPLGGLDGVALVKIIGVQFSELRFPVNDLLLAVDRFKPILIPINKHGSQSREAAIKSNEAYASLDQQILMFPAGLVSRKINGKIVDLLWQKNFINKAIEYQRDIVPVYIDGKNSDRFYNLSNWRKRLGIKFNIEMLFLPDEMFKQKNQTIKITIGEPISYTTFSKATAQGDAAFVKNIVYKLNA